MTSIYSEHNDANSSTRYESEGIYDIEEKETLIKNIYSISVENCIAIKFRDILLQR